MKRTLRSALSLLLIFVMLLATGCKGSGNSTPTDTNNTAGTGAIAGTTNATQSNTDSTETPQPEKPFVPALRFVVTSDIHTREKPDDLQSHQRLAELYETAYDYADNHPDYQKLDGIFFVGDISNGGTEQQQTYFFNYVKENTREGTFARAVMGNHEFYATGNYSAESLKQAPLNFLEYSGYETTDYHTTIGGYHFIFLSLDMYNKSSSRFFSSDKLVWLKQELAAAVADTPDKPIFLFQHIPPLNTMIGSTSACSDQLLAQILKDYPQVIDFSGHTHVTMTNPQSIWQGRYTAINTGSLAYLSIPIFSADGKMTRPAQADDTGKVQSSFENGTRNAAMYYIVEISEDGVVRLLRYNIFTRSLWGDPVVFDSIDPADFDYTTNGKAQATAPVFDASAAITVESADAAAPVISFPQAVCKDLVANYRVEIYQGDTMVASKLRIAETFLGDATPQTLKTYLEKLDPGTYTVKVFATSSYALHSEPITATITLQ